MYWRAARWQADGSTETMHDQLRERVRLLAGRNAAQTAAVIDSQSVRAAEEVARTSRWVRISQCRLAPLGTLR